MTNTPNPSSFPEGKIAAVTDSAEETINDAETTVSEATSGLIDQASEAVSDAASQATEQVEQVSDAAKAIVQETVEAPLEHAVAVSESLPTEMAEAAQGAGIPEVGSPATAAAVAATAAAAASAVNLQESATPVQPPSGGPASGDGANGSVANANFTETLVSVRDLKMYFPVTEGAIIPRVVANVKAVDGVSFDIMRGETLGLVGESGCGKTTTGRCIIQLEKATEGEIWFDGVNLAKASKEEMRPLRQRIQIIFQDPYSSLNPRMKIGDIIAEPMMVHGIEPDHKARMERVRYLLTVCGLRANFADRYPHEMSGGQRQRVGIARALAVKPEFIICDEAVSALDVSIQAQVINLLEDLRDEFDLTYLFISHDLSVVRHLCHRVAVMYLGNMVELTDCDELFDNPLHPYTRALLGAVPIPDPSVEAARAHEAVIGEIPSPINPPSGCVFHPRCPIATDECSKKAPEFREVKPGHWVACHEVG